MTGATTRYHFVGVTLATMSTKVMGFLRSMIIASFLGASLYLDIFYSINILIGLLIIVFADQMEMVFSCESARLFKADPAKLPHFERQAFTASLLVGTSLCALLWITLPLTTPLLLPTLSPENSSMVPVILLAGLPFALLYLPFRAMLALLRGRGAVTFSILSDALQSFLLCACTLLALALLRDGDAAHSVIRLASAHGAAFFLSTLITFIYWWRGLGGIPVTCLDRTFLALVLAPLTELSLLNYFMFGFTLIDRRYAGVAQAGGVALLTYASSLSLTARSIINYEQLHVLDFAGSNNRQYLLTRAVWQCLLLSIPWTVLLFVFADEIVLIVYQRGAFTAEMTSQCAEVLKVYGAATTIFLIWQIALRMLQVERLVRPLLFLVPTLLVIDILLAHMLVPVMGVPGAVLSTLLIHLPLLAAAEMALRLRKKLSMFSMRMILAALLYLCFSCLCATAVQRLFPDGWFFPLQAALFFALAYLPLPLLWSRHSLYKPASPALPG